MDRSSNNSFWRGVGVGIVIMPTLAFVFFVFWEIGLLKVIKDFFEEWRYVLTGLGYSAVVIGLYFTFIQIRRAKDRSKAHISYQIRKNGREIFSSLTDDVIKYIEETDKDSNDAQKVIPKGLRKIHEILMHYDSIYDQWQHDNFDDFVFQQDVLNEICDFLKKDRVNRYWKEKIVKKGLWEKEFIKMIEERFNQKEEKK